MTSEESENNNNEWIEEYLRMWGDGEEVEEGKLKKNGMSIYLFTRRTTFLFVFEILQVVVCKGILYLIGDVLLALNVGWRANVVL